jgi:hypothetical protein
MHYFPYNFINGIIKFLNYFIILLINFPLLLNDVFAILYIKFVYYIIEIII